jgi:hypothetical protein
MEEGRRDVSGNIDDIQASAVLSQGKILKYSTDVNLLKL